MESYGDRLLSSIYHARERGIVFFEKNLFLGEAGWRYTSTHDLEKYPAAVLYGTWSGVLGLHLLKKTDFWDSGKIQLALAKLNSERKDDGSFFPIALEDTRTSKSREYLTLHCTNYCLGAALSIDARYDFEVGYLNRFLDGDYLKYWLDARSLQRPWEEGNNIVNVCSYLALSHENGNPKAYMRLSQMLDWHKKNQNPKTAGFDSFASPSYQQHLESLAGAVHNFHLYLYLDEGFGFEDQIIPWVQKFLVQGQLTACQSIDFVELAVRLLPHSERPQQLVNALLLHAEALLQNQQSDGGWLENDNGSPSSAAGFLDNQVSSCSYATWFRLAALGMIAINLLGDTSENWGFRKTLGMGYAPNRFYCLPDTVKIKSIEPIDRAQNYFGNLPRKVRTEIIRLGGKLLK